MNRQLTPDLLRKLRDASTGPRADLEVCRHVFHGEVAYVVRDPITFQNHKFSAADYEVLTALAPNRPLRTVFESLVREGRLREEQEPDFYELVLSLYRLGFVSLPFADGGLLYRRYERRRRAEKWRRITGFLFLRVPLWNPDVWLDRTVRFVRPLFGPAAVALWTLVMALCLTVLVVRWPSFQSPLASILATRSLVVLWLTLIALKIVHELGHAYACKVFGGNVPEMGAFFIVFTPCAYVDASAAWGFSSLRQRIAVSLAGMYFESIVAAIAFAVWNLTGPSPINSLAHHVVVVSTVVTLGFNLNPLMRFDGYYVLSDLLGIPNLREHGVSLMKSWGKRVLLGIRPGPSHFPPRISLLVLLFGIASSVYRVLVTVGICCVVSLKFFWVGVGLAAVYLVSTFLSLAVGWFRYLCRSPEIAPIRRRAVWVSVGTSVAILLVVAGVPVSRSTKLTGVVQGRDDMVVHARTAGFLVSPPAPAGTVVRRGDRLMRLENSVVDARVRQAEADVERLALALRYSISADPSTAAVSSIRLANARKQLDSARQEQDELAIHSSTPGQVIRILGPRHQRRFVSRGEPVATVAAGDWAVRCLATSEQMADIRPKVGGAARIRLVADAQFPMTGTVRRVAEQGSPEIRDESLTQLGGGDIAVRPDTREAEQSFFEILVEVDNPLPLRPRHGMTAHVRFDSPPRTLAEIVVRRARQFLHRLSGA